MDVLLIIMNFFYYTPSVNESLTCLDDRRFQLYKYTIRAILSNGQTNIESRKASPCYDKCKLKYAYLPNLKRLILEIYNLKFEVIRV